MANDEQKKVAKKKATKKTAAKKVASKKATAKKEATPKATAKPSVGKMRVTQIKSLIGTIGRHRDSVRGLGLRRVNHTVEVEDTPATRGMVNKVRYLVRIEKD